MSTGRELRERVALAIERGVTFLSDRQRPHGELSVRVWRPLVPEWLPDPSVFATALIVHSLRDVPGTDSLRVRACDFLSAQMERFGVWRHWTRGHAQFDYVPPDLDDTSLTSLALVENGRAVPDHRALLLANRDGRGLFFSWITLRRRWVSNVAYWWISLVHFVAHPLRSTSFYKITPSHRHDVDAVVNANVLFYLGAGNGTEAVERYVLGVLREHRELESDKWYDNPFVIWFFFSRALRRAGVDAAAIVLGRLRSAEPQSPLERALSISVLLDWNEDVAEAEVRALLEGQLPSGGWPLAPFYKGRNVRWGSEELTTAFCLAALHRWLRAEGP